jgi:hypothetical protein
MWNLAYGIPIGSALTWTVRPQCSTSIRSRSTRHPRLLGRASLTLHTAPDPPAAALEEVDAVVLDVESHKVTAEHALEDVVAPGEDAHDVPGGEGDVQEESHPDLQLFLNARIPDNHSWWRKYGT